MPLPSGNTTQIHGRNDRLLTTAAAETIVGCSKTVNRQTKRINQYLCVWVSVCNSFMCLLYSALIASQTAFMLFVYPLLWLPLCSSFSARITQAVIYQSATFLVVRLYIFAPLRRQSTGQDPFDINLFAIYLSQRATQRFEGPAHSISSSINFTLDLIIFTYAQ